MRAGILIEGSSSASGLFDDSRRGGFAGRIESHYDAYNEFSSLGIQQEPSWVDVYKRALPDRHPIDLAKTLPDHIHEARTRINRGKLVGVILLSLLSDYQRYKYGEAKAINRWTTGISELSDILHENNINPIIMTSPRVSETSPLKAGIVHDPTLQNTFISYAKGLAYDLRAPFIPFEQALGGNVLDYAAIDNRHTNGEGYQRIADHLIPLLDHMLGITYNDDVEDYLQRTTIKTAKEITA